MNREIKMLVLALGCVALTFGMLAFASGAVAGLICMLALAASFTVFFIFTRWRYKRIAEMGEYLRRMASGQYSFDMRDNAEGELSILKNEMYTLSSKMEGNVQRLTEDRKVLKESLADISHQLKTPLTSMGVMAALLESEDLPAEKRKEFTTNLRGEIARMEWLVLALLKAAQLDADIAEMKPRPVQAASLIARAVESLEIMLDLRGQAVQMLNHEPFSINCDLRWTAEALGNILKNASEHSPDGGQIKVDYGENPLFAWVSVQDSGPGVSRQDIPHLFQRFYRAAGAKEDSMGIGLPLSLAILRRQGGDIEVRQAEGQGLALVLKFYRQNPEEKNMWTVTG